MNRPRLPGSCTSTLADAVQVIESVPYQLVRMMLQEPNHPSTRRTGCLDLIAVASHPQLDNGSERENAPEWLVQCGFILLVVLDQNIALTRSAHTQRACNSALLALNWRILMPLVPEPGLKEGWSDGWRECFQLSRTESDSTTK